MLKGRLGLETARIPQGDRHGLLWLGRGNLVVEDGTLHFRTVGDGDLDAGDYVIPYQMLSCLLLQPGATVSHDALRLLAGHGTGLVFVGGGGVRLYASMPFGPDESARARRQVRLWSDPQSRVFVARRMYAWRLKERFPDADIAVLRGMEGARVRKSYELLAKQHGISWGGRRYDREKPENTDLTNQAINHATTALQGLGMTAVAVVGCIPQLGFIHEDSGRSLCLDVADIYREEVAIPAAFRAVRETLDEHRIPRGTEPNPADRAKHIETLERRIRSNCGRDFRRHRTIEKMIDRLKELFDGDDDSGDGQRT